MMLLKIGARMNRATVRVSNASGTPRASATAETARA
jgi:hypothetical protein